MWCCVSLLFFIRVHQVFLKSPNSRENISEHSSTACGDTWAVLKLSTRREHSAETATQKQLSKSRACAGQSSPSCHCNAQLCTPIQSRTIFKPVFPSLSPYGSINWSYNHKKGTTDILQLFFSIPTLSKQIYLSRQLQNHGSAQRSLTICTRKPFISWLWYGCNACLLQPRCEPKGDIALSGCKNLRPPSGSKISPEDFCKPFLCHQGEQVGCLQTTGICQRLQGTETERSASCGALWAAWGGLEWRHGAARWAMVTVPY